MTVRHIFYRVAQVLLTFLFLFAASRLIQWNDVAELELTLKDGSTVRGEPVIITHTPGWSIMGLDGKTHTYQDGDLASSPRHTSRPGFFSLLREVDLTAFFIFSVITILPIVFITFRWRLILKVQDIPIGFKRAMAINYAGLFFNHILPGAAGGDIVRGVLMARGSDRKAAMVGTILLDRFIGLGTLVLMAAAVVALNFNRPELKNVATSVLAAAAGMLAVYLLYLSKTIRSTAAFRKFKEWVPFREVIQDIDQVMTSMKGRRKYMLYCIFLSVVAQSSTILVIYGLARSLGLSQVELSHCFIFVPIICIVNALPISFGGWGVGELAYAVLFGSIGVPQTYAISLSLLYRLVSLLAALPGGILFFVVWSRRHHSAPATPPPK